MYYSDNHLTNLAQNNPKELVRLLLGSTVDINVLASGAEILCGEVSDESIVLPALRSLLRHVNVAVREGACIGVTAFYVGKQLPADIVERLKAMSINDPSPILREYVKSILDDFNCDSNNAKKNINSD